MNLSNYIAPSSLTLPEDREYNWVPKFLPLFTRAGIDLEDSRNRISVPHQMWPRGDLYYQLVYERLLHAALDLEGDAFREAFLAELAAIAEESTTLGRYLNGIITITP